MKISIENVDLAAGDFIKQNFFNQHRILLAFKIICIRQNSLISD